MKVNVLRSETRELFEMDEKAARKLVKNFRGYRILPDPVIELSEEAQNIVDKVNKVTEQVTDQTPKKKKRAKVDPE